jgi:outer membrane immunogenic protein
MKRLVIFIALAMNLTALNAFAKDVDSDLDALGGNKDLMERANAIDPNNKTRVVQNRLVDRDLRLELGVNYGVVAGGDPYVDTANLGAQLDFHLDPHWSIGARYYHSANSLSSEGQRVSDAAAANTNSYRPDIDYVKDTYFGTITFYPFYGKLNLADLAITQFDVYFVGGYGEVSLDRGNVGAYTGGMGLAFWLSKHFSTRLEVRYEGYKDTMLDGTSRQMDLTVMSLGFGFLL